MVNNQPPAADKPIYQRRPSPVDENLYLKQACATRQRVQIHLLTGRVIACAIISRVNVYTIVIVLDGVEHLLFKNALESVSPA